MGDLHCLGGGGVLKEFQHWQIFPKLHLDQLYMGRSLIRRGGRERAGALHF